MEIKQTSCCGVDELDGISDGTARDNMRELCIYRYEEDKVAFYIFTGESKKKYGKEFKAFILKHKLGKVIETNTHKNPNSGNMIKVWVWQVNNKALDKYTKKNGYDNEADNKW